MPNGNLGTKNFTKPKIERDVELIAYLRANRNLSDAKVGHKFHISRQRAWYLRVKYNLQKQEKAAAGG